MARSASTRASRGIAGDRWDALYSVHLLRSPDPNSLCPRGSGLGPGQPAGAWHGQRGRLADERQDAVPADSVLVDVMRRRIRPGREHVQVAAIARERLVG